MVFMLSLGTQNCLQACGLLADAVDFVIRIAYCWRGEWPV